MNKNITTSASIHSIRTPARGFLTNHTLHPHMAQSLHQGIFPQEESSPMPHLLLAVHQVFERGISLPEATWHNLAAHDTKVMATTHAPTRSISRTRHTIARTVQPRATEARRLWHTPLDALQQHPPSKSRSCSLAGAAALLQHSCTHVRHCFLRELPPPAASVAPVCVTVTL